MKSKTCLLAVPLLAFALPGQRPQIGPNDAYVTTREHGSIADTLGLGTVTNLFTGRCSGLNARDVLGLADGSPLIWVWPSAHTTACQFPDANGAPITGVRDMALLVGRGGTADRDAVALVGQDGLRIWRRQVGSAAFLVDTIDPANFAGARLVAAHHTDSSSIFCVLANGTSIGVSRATGGSYGAAQSVFSVLDDGGAPTTVLAIAAVDWDADGVADVAALTAGGLVTYDRNGAEIARSTYQAEPPTNARPARSITVVRYTNLVLLQPRECIAWLAPTRTGGQCLLMRGAEVTNEETDIVLAHGNHLAISAADWTGDGEDELFLTGAADGKVSMLVGAGGLVPWLFIESVGFDIAVARGAQDPAPVALGDLDADGDGDLFAVVGATCSEVQSKVTQREYHLDVGTGTIRSGDPTPGLAEPILVTFNLPEPPTVPGFGSGVELEATLWVREQGELDPAPFARSYFPIVSGRSSPAFTIDNQLLLGENYLLMVRPVRRDAQQNVIDAGKAWQHRLFPIHGGGTPVPGITPLPVLPPVPPLPPIPPT